MPKPGEAAPDFEGTLADGSRVCLSEALGKGHVVLYFFPRDFTPGCTREACSFRDHHEEIASLGAAIYGVSVDAPDRHASFAEKFRLPFPLISDGDCAIARAYDVLRMGGLLFNKRVTYVIDRSGTIRGVIHSELNMDRHVERATAVLRKFQRPAT